MAEKRVPSRPQQDPGFSPVRSSMRHLGHRLSAARLFEDEPQVKRGVEIGLIAQVFQTCFVTSIGEHGIMKNICAHAENRTARWSAGSRIHLVERFAGGAYCDTAIYSIEVVVSLLSSL